MDTVTCLLETDLRHQNSLFSGPDWKSENQDGKGPGTVIRCHKSDRKVKVIFTALVFAPTFKAQDFVVVVVVVVKS